MMRKFSADDHRFLTTKAQVLNIHSKKILRFLVNMRYETNSVVSASGKTDETLTRNLQETKYPPTGNSKQPVKTSWLMFECRSYIHELILDGMFVCECGIIFE